MESYRLEFEFEASWFPSRILHPGMFKVVIEQISVQYR
jgi:hypothetical protein